MSEITFRLPSFVPLKSRIFDLRSSMSGSPKAEILSGLTVALALVPEAVAFAFLAGVPPLVGLYAAFIICLVTSVLGGRPGMISGATGAMGVVVVALVALHGIGYLFPAVVLCGLIQITIGLFKFGKFIRIVPHPVMLGFVNGLAVVILLAQFGSFKTLGADGSMQLLEGSRLWIMIGLVALTMAIIAFLPRFTRAVPSSLAAILIVSLVAFGMNWFSADTNDDADPALLAANNTTSQPVLTVRDMLVDSTRAAAVTAAQRDKDSAILASAQSGLPANIAVVEIGQGPISPLTEQETIAAVDSVDVETVGIAGGLPRFAWLDFQMPPLAWSTFWIILPFSLILAGVGLIESLMTMTLIDELTETRGRGNRECVGQGVANVTWASSEAWAAAR
jgi:SulP family sulfate permease